MGVVLEHWVQLWAPSTKGTWTHWSESNTTKMLKGLTTSAVRRG